MNYKEKIIAILNDKELSQEQLEHIFSELKETETEDEKIRKVLIDMFKGYNIQKVGDFTDKEIIAWLEKQGLQKHADKVEPKFKVGDWIVTPANKVFQITSIEGTSYKFDNESHYWEICYCDEQCRLWTIQDAKDGDVLASKDKLDILIFRKLDVDAYFSSYYNIKGKGELGWSIKNFIPATKEQRELLFQKMHEEGKEWDSDKKELKRISLVSAARVFLEELSKTPYNNKPITDAQIMTKELLNFLQNPASYNPDALNEQKPAWSEEDEMGLEDALWAMKIAAKIAKDENDMGNIWYAENWLKSLKERLKVQWKPSEEQIQALEYQVHSTYKGSWQYKASKELLEQLKKL